MPETRNENKLNKGNFDMLNEEPINTAFKDKKSSSDTGKPVKNSILFYILTIITAFLLVALIIGGIFFLAIKNNVNGIGESMGDSVKNIPILSWALPEKPEPEDEKNMTEEEVRKKYIEIKAEKILLDEKLSDLNKQVEQLNKQVSAKDSNSSLLQQQKDTLEKDKLTLAADNASLKKDLEDISSTIANGDTAEFKKYFEKIDPKIAADIYAQVLKDEEISEDVKKYCSIYETMDASAVAEIMEQMGSGKMTLIIEIMKNLKKDTSADILTEMTPAFAAELSVQLAKEYNVGTPKATK